MDVRRLLLVPVLLAVLAFSGPAAAQGYVVQPGDSLYTIAQRFGTTVDKLRAANNLWHTSEIWAGTWLRLPAGLSHTYTVQAGDSLYLIAQRLGTTVTQLRQANNLWGTDLILVGQVLAVPRSGAGSNPGGGSPPPGSGIHLSPSDLDLLAQLVTAEAEGESYEGQVAVAATVLNRLRDPRYPDTVSGVIFQYVNGLPQFSPVANGRIYLPATETARQAVLDALKGWDPTNGALGFYNPAKTSNQWVRQQPVTSAIGNHLFFRIP
ncbi:cell wall hydrolase [Limnochorda pilosa]|uniref:cell wall hydrolase n=1 Tax=Limnochorda pilosa TaxID=1555112 RepID=UPI0026EB47AA|nr:cell wall hydrolase [Limnochorda pilosa]